MSEKGKILRFLTKANERITLFIALIGGAIILIGYLIDLGELFQDPPFTDNMQSKVDSMTDENVSDVLDFIEPSGVNAINPLLMKLGQENLTPFQEKEIINFLVYLSGETGEQTLVNKTKSKFDTFLKRQLARGEVGGTTYGRMIAYISLLDKMKKDKANIKKYLMSKLSKIERSSFHEDDKFYLKLSIDDAVKN